MKRLLLALVAASLPAALAAETGPDQAAADEAAAETPPAADPPPPSLARALAIPGVSPRLDLTAFVQDAVAGDGDGSARFTGRAAPRAVARRGARG